ncbi:MAG: hypothetical protein J5I98_14330 [Phaeodactylibacter sp.]|nr:hypothetical protein [Phaeodactylibacter sp.]
MKGINIFLSDKIRLHPLEFTSDGLGMATGPYTILEPDVTDEVFERALFEAFTHSRSGVPRRALTREEEKAYYRALGIKSHRELGIGADITEENGRYTVTPVNKSGLFGKPVEAGKEELLPAVKKALALGTAMEKEGASKVR